MKTLEGKPLADAILERVKTGVAELDRAPGFSAILIGDDPASRMYVDLKKKSAHMCGMLFCDYALPNSVSQEQVVQIINFLNGDPEIDGILVQLPLPKHLEKKKILNAVDSTKDVDGLSDVNRTCARESAECFVSPFPRAISLMLDSAETSLENKKAVVLCNSRIFGEVMVELLTPKGLESVIILADQKGENISLIQDADIIISAVGRRNFVTSHMVKDGAIVIDGGIEKIEGDVSGDVATAEFEKRDVTITPVPGGVGPVTVACLMENVFLASRRRCIM